MILSFVLTLGAHQWCNIVSSMSASSVVDRVIRPQANQSDISICCFSANHPSLRRRADWLTQKSQNERVHPVQSRHHHHFV